MSSNKFSDEFKRDAGLSGRALEVKIRRFRAGSGERAGRGAGAARTAGRRRCCAPKRPDRSLRDRYPERRRCGPAGGRIGDQVLERQDQVMVRKGRPHARPPGLLARGAQQEAGRRGVRPQPCWPVLCSRVRRLRRARR